MGAAVTLWDVIGEGQDIFVIGVIPPHCHFDADIIARAFNINRLLHDGGFGAVKIFHKFAHTAVIIQLTAQRFSWAQVFKNNPHT